MHKIYNPVAACDRKPIIIVVQTKERYFFLM